MKENDKNITEIQMLRNVFLFSLYLPLAFSPLYFSLYLSPLYPLNFYFSFIFLPRSFSVSLFFRSLSLSNVYLSHYLTISLYLSLYMYIYIQFQYIDLLTFFCLYRPVAAEHFRPSSSGGLGALPLGALRLGALPLEAFFSSDFIFRFERRCFLLCGQVEKSSLRLFREGGCRQYKPSSLCTSCIYRLLACMAVLFQESST